MIDPSPNAIVSGNDGSDDLIPVLRDPKEIGLNPALAANEFDRVVPRRIGGEDCGPERYNRVVITVLINSNDQAARIHRKPTQVPALDDAAQLACMGP